MRLSRSVLFASILLIAILPLAGCPATGPSTQNPRTARLCEEEMYHMDEQMRAMQKQLDEAKDAAASATKDKNDMEKAIGENASLLMDQLKDRDAQIEKLTARIAELEKAQTSPAAK
jgi:hypothetical protein